MSAARSLFDAPAPAARPAPGPRVDPRLHICRACHRVGATCGVGDAWFCVEHAPADFWPHTRTAGQR